MQFVMICGLLTVFLDSIHWCKGTLLLSCCQRRLTNYPCYLGGKKKKRVSGKQASFYNIEMMLLLHDRMVWVGRAEHDGRTEGDNDLLQPAGSACRMGYFSAVFFCCGSYLSLQQDRSQDCYVLVFNSCPLLLPMWVLLLLFLPISVSMYPSCAHRISPSFPPCPSVWSCCRCPP